MTDDKSDTNESSPIKKSESSDTALQDGLRDLFNDPSRNNWIVEKQINKEAFDFRDYVKRFLWKKK